MNTPAVHASPTRKQAATYLLAIIAIWAIGLCVYTGDLLLAVQVIAVMAGILLVALTVLAVIFCITTLIFGPMP